MSSGKSVSKTGNSKKTAKLFAVMQKFGGAMMMPIAILPACGLLLGLGYALVNQQLLSVAPFMANGFWQKLSEIFIGVGGAIFNNLPIIFAVGIAIGLANDGAAGLAALVGYFMMNQTINVFLEVDAEKLATESTKFTTILGVGTLQTGAFGGIVIGIAAYFMYKRFHDIELPQYLGFFQAKRFVPIATSVVSIAIGIVFSLFWPYIQTGIFDAMSSVLSSDNPSILAVFIYGFVFKFLGIFGLHHLVYPIYYYQLGSYTTIAGNIIQGDQAIYFAQLADGVEVTAGACMGGSFIIYMIGLLGAALAIYKCAKPESRKRVSGMLIAACMASAITGITEPLEFMFAFTAFPLYVVHSILTGLGYAACPALGIHVGTSFSGGLIDYILCSVLPGAPRWFLVIPVGLVFAAVYYVVFSFMIKMWNLNTPGREDEEDETESVIEKKSDSEEILQIIAALGGADNIVTVGACFTRLRVSVKDNTKVDDKKFKQLGASNVLRVGEGVQIIFGTRSARLKDKVNAALGK